MITDGKYKARAIEGALGRTSKGNEQVAVLLEITEGEHLGSQYMWYGYFTPLTVERTLESLRFLGWESDDLNDLKGITANEVTVIIALELNNEGQLRPRVKWINAHGGLVMKDRLDETAARSFAQRMKGAAIASRAKSKVPSGNGSTAKPSTANGPANADHSTDDIPF